MPADAFRGTALDEKLGAYGQVRLDQETDWEFRKRTFPTVFAQNYHAAAELIFAARMDEWDEWEKVLFMELFHHRPRPDRLRVFVDSFSEDPLLRRMRRQAV